MIYCKYCNTNHEEGTFFNAEGKCSVQIHKERVNEHYTMKPNMVKCSKCSEMYDKTRFMAIGGECNKCYKERELKKRIIELYRRAKTSGLSLYEFKEGMKLLEMDAKGKDLEHFSTEVEMRYNVKVITVKKGLERWF